LQLRATERAAKGKARQGKKEEGKTFFFMFILFTIF
jgi:hypothetical protein